MVPVQPLATGVMVNVTVIGALVVFIKVPDMLPLPEAAIPVTLAVLFKTDENCSCYCACNYYRCDGTLRTNILC